MRRGSLASLGDRSILISGIAPDRVPYQDRNYLIVLMLLLLGIRRGELLKLRVADGVLVLDNQVALLLALWSENEFLWMGVLGGHGQLRSRGEREHSAIGEGDL